jgi:hypothetical protein
MMDAIWTLLNTEAVVVAIASIVGWLLVKLYAAKPEWQKWEGTIISAVKYAEKAVPDDQPGWQKLDEALKYVMRVYAEVEGKRPSKKTQEDLAEGIQIVHADLEANGQLYKHDGSE